MYYQFIIFGVSIATILIDSAMTQMINGLEVTTNTFKYQVLIITNDNICGGAIIDEYHVLTAAHCVDTVARAEILVIAGALFLDDSNEIPRNVKNVHPHPNFTRHAVEYIDANNTQQLSRLKNDIAVLTFYDALTLKGNVGKINLPTSNAPYCEPCFVAGWGATTVNSIEPSSRLKWITMIIRTPDSCADDGIYHRANEFCASEFFEMRTVGKGDSGSPLRCNGKIVGIVSSGWADPEIPAVFTNVYEHLEFIQGSMND